MTGVLDRFTTTTVVLGEDDARLLSSSDGGYRVVEVVPPRDDGEVPVAVPRFIHSIMELQTRLLGLANASPVSVFELRRDHPDRIRLQFAVPTRRLERKVRLHLTESVPGVKFTTGVSGLPVSDGDTVGGGLLTVGRQDVFPLETDFERPPTDNIVAALHRDAFPRENVVIQVLFQPIAGRPVREWLWKRKAFRRVGWLRKEKHAVTPGRNRPATPIEKRQSEAVEGKARNPQFRVGIRFVFTGTPPDLLRSRVKELAGAFNVFESAETNQYLDAHTVSAWNEDGIINFAEAVAYRHGFDRYVLSFRAGIPELAGLVAVPSIKQDNIRRAKP